MEARRKVKGREVGIRKKKVSSKFERELKMLRVHGELFRGNRQ